MGPFVLAQITEKTVLLAAHLAFVRLLSGVSAIVFHKDCLQAKRLDAHQAFVRFLSSVNEFVLLKFAA